MSNLYNRLPLVKFSLIICVLLCYFDHCLTLSESRRKRDNEAILYGNQQGSPHLSVKKSGRNPLESKMHSINHLENENESYPDDFDEKYNFEAKRKLLKRAKRSLIKRSMENIMAPSRMLKRKKRYVDDMDPSTLEKLRDLLANNYDSYYSDGDNDETIPYVVQEPEYEETRLEKRMSPEEIVEPESIPYEFVEVNGVRGLFFPLYNEMKERENLILNKRRQMEEKLYRSKLEKLAEMLANEK